MQTVIHVKSETFYDSKNKTKYYKNNSPNDRDKATVKGPGLPGMIFNLYPSGTSNTWFPCIGKTTIKIFFSLYEIFAIIY